MMTSLVGPRMRSLLAVDAVATVLAGLLILARPAWLCRLAALGDRPLLRVLSERPRARQAGAVVAVFGLVKGSLYAIALARVDAER